MWTIGSKLQARLFGFSINGKKNLNNYDWGKLTAIRVLVIGAMIWCVKLIKRCVNFCLAKRTTAKICKGDLDEKNGSFLQEELRYRYLTGKGIILWISRFSWSIISSKKLEKNNSRKQILTTPLKKHLLFSKEQ